MSKGSGRRPQEADDKHVASEWDRLFGGVQTEDKDGLGLARVKRQGDVAYIKVKGEHVPSHVYNEYIKNLNDSNP